MLDFIQNNLTLIVTVAGVLYPPALFLLPAKYATKINFVVKAGKTIFTALEKAEQTKAGFSLQKEVEDLQKKYVQKSKD